MSQITPLQSTPPLETADRFFKCQTVSELGEQLTIRELSIKDLQAWQNEMANKGGKESDIEAMILLLSYTLFDGKNQRKMSVEFVESLPARLIMDWANIALRLSGLSEPEEREKKGLHQTPPD